MSERIVGQIWTYPPLGEKKNGNHYYLVLAYHGLDGNWHRYTLFDYQKNKEIPYSLQSTIEEQGMWSEA